MAALIAVGLMNVAAMVVLITVVLLEKSGSGVGRCVSVSAWRRSYWR